MSTRFGLFGVRDRSDAHRCRPLTGRSGADHAAPARPTRRICRSPGARPRTSRGRRRSAALACRRRSCPAIASSSRRRSAPAFAGRQSSATRAGIRRQSASERSLPDSGAAGRRSHVLRRRGLQPQRRHAAVAAPAGSDRTAARRPRQAQPGEPEPGDGRADGVRLVRHRADRRARHERQGCLAAASRPGNRALRHQLGARELADAVRRYRSSCCAITRRPRICSPSTRRPARNAGGWIAARDGCRTRRRSSSRSPTGPELIVNSSQRVDAYDPRTGAFLWHVGGSNQFPIPAPTFHDGVIYMTRGYRSGPYMAIRPGGRGDISASHVVWEVPTGAPYISSLVYDEGILYMASDVGAVTAIDAATGRRIWQQRVDGHFFGVAGRGATARSISSARPARPSC